MYVWYNTTGEYMILGDYQLHKSFFQKNYILV